jgi:hypothetical protein
VLEPFTGWTGWGIGSSASWIGVFIGNGDGDGDGNGGRLMIQHIF